MNSVSADFRSISIYIIIILLLHFVLGRLDADQEKIAIMLENLNSLKWKRIPWNKKAKWRFRHDISSRIWHYTTSVRARRHVNANFITYTSPSRLLHLDRLYQQNEKNKFQTSFELAPCTRLAFFDIKDFLPSHTLTLMQSQLHLIHVKCIDFTIQWSLQMLAAV